MIGVFEFPSILYTESEIGIMLGLFKGDNVKLIWTTQLDLRNSGMQEGYMYRVEITELLFTIYCYIDIYKIWNISNYKKWSGYMVTTCIQSDLKNVCEVHEYTRKALEYVREGL